LALPAAALLWLPAKPYAAAFCLKNMLKAAFWLLFVNFLLADVLKRA